MIKKWKEFNESSTSGKINISDFEIDIFQNEPALKKLISDEKASLIGNEVSFDINDKETLDILNIYFDVNLLQ
jgi:hypothetical protein